MDSVNKTIDGIANTLVLLVADQLQGGMVLGKRYMDFIGLRRDNIKAYITK